MRRGIPLGPVQHLLKGLPSYIPSSRRSEASSRLVDVGQPQIHVAASWGHHQEGGVELHAADWSDVASIEHAHLRQPITSSPHMFNDWVKKTYLDNVNHLVTGVCIPCVHPAIRWTGYDVFGVGWETTLDGDAAVVHVTGEGLKVIWTGNVL